MDERIIAKKLEILSQRAILQRQPIEGWAVRQARFQDVGAYAYAGDWELLEGPGSFAALQTVFLRTTSCAPEPAMPSSQVFIRFDIEGLEALLSLDGKPYAGLDRNHTRVPAPPPGEHELEIEAMSLLRAYCQPELRSRESWFRGAAWIQVDSRIEAAVYDLRLCAEAVRVVGDVRRRERLSEALERALLEIDLTLSDDELRGNVGRAQALLAELVGRIRPDPEGGSVYLAGHTHIDTAWLWPLKETVRKCGRTFSTAVRLMKQYPDFHFSCSQAQLYAYTKEHYPELYQEIKTWVAAGRWHTTGAMWVETDCNVPSGESLIRQILYGLEFYDKEFGTRPRTCWLPDVFGYPASLPQILEGCGVPYFFTCKLHWQSSNPFPNHLFWWEGVDGSRVMAHIPKLRSYYNGYPNPEQLTIAWGNYLQKAVHGEVMLPFGYGDGGGGVTPEMVELATRSGAYPGLPATRLGDEESYFDQALDHADGLPVWQGELYLETHRGTYTTQSRTKQANRVSERALREAELWTSVACVAGAPLSTQPLKGVWLDVLTQQFHDILPGSSIGEVYVDALADHRRAQQTAGALRDQALDWLVAEKKIGGDLCVFNPLSWARSDPVQASLSDPGEEFELVDARGRACPVQVLGQDGDRVHILFEPHLVPAMGWASFAVRPAVPPPSTVCAAGRVMESDLYRLEFDSDGALSRLLDKRANREVVPSGERANVWQLFQDGPEREAAWNVHDTFEKRQYPISGTAAITAVESGPVRAVIRVERTHRQTQMAYHVILYHRSPRIDFVADVDWQERQTMLKVAFPVTVRSANATYEIQFGAVQRPTHRNTSWDQVKFEVAAQRWADLSEAGYGVSLLNDSRYGYDVKGNVLRLTALRSPEFPDPDADRGQHHFGYALLPHAGDWGEGETVRRAREYNDPMTAVDLSSLSSGAPEEHSCLMVSGKGVVLETFKPAQDGDGWIVRLYEAHGGRGPVKLRADRPIVRGIQCNLVEEPGGALEIVDGGIELSMHPFQIWSVRVWFA